MATLEAGQQVMSTAARCLMTSKSLIPGDAAEFIQLQSSKQEATPDGGQLAFGQEASGMPDPSGAADHIHAIAD